MCGNTTQPHIRPIRAFSRGKSVRNAYGKYSGFTTRKRRATVVLAGARSAMRPAHHDFDKAAGQLAQRELARTGLVAVLDRHDLDRAAAPAIGDQRRGDLREAEIALLRLRPGRAQVGP